MWKMSRELALEENVCLAHNAAACLGIEFRARSNISIISDDSFQIHLDRAHNSFQIATKSKSSMD